MAAQLQIFYSLQQQGEIRAYRKASLPIKNVLTTEISHRNLLWNIFIKDKYYSIQQINKSVKCRLQAHHNIFSQSRLLPTICVRRIQFTRIYPKKMANSTVSKSPLPAIFSIIQFPRVESKQFFNLYRFQGSVLRRSARNRSRWDAIGKLKF